MAFSKSIQTGQIPVNCQLCETTKVIGWKCIECNLLMCKNCRDKIHPKFRNAKDHKIVDIKDVGHYNEQLDFSNIKCDDHSGQFSCLFCKRCDRPVYPTCVSKIHKKHANDLIEISEAYEMTIERIKKEHRQFEGTKATMTTRKDQLEQLKTTENSKHTKVMHDILTHKKSMKKIVDNYFEMLEMDLENTSQRVLQSIEHELSATIGSIQEIESKTDAVKYFINIKNAAEFFQNIKKMGKSIIVNIAQTTKNYESIPKFIPGEINQSNVGVLQTVESKSTELSVDMVINKTFETNLSVVSYVSRCMNYEKSIWIVCRIDKVVKRVQPDGNKLKVLSSLNTEVYGMAILQSHDILLSTGGHSLQQLNFSTGKLSDTVYNVAPLASTAIHITSGNKVVVGGINVKLEKTAVFIMNAKGKHKTVYEHDQHNQPIFNYPENISSTSNGNIHVVDCNQGSDRGRVVVLGQRGNTINTYTGHTEINKDSLFKPANIVTTLRDNVIVIDINTHTLHFLNDAGHLMTYQNTSIKGIEHPYSLAFTQTGQLFIGCSRTKGSTEKKAEIHEVTITGC